MPSSVVPPIPETEVPTWKSPNELIHERINFDDTIWGFGLAGGAYYKTPLRITYVKPGSRAQMAHIYPGDVVLRINGIESSTLTLEEAHQIILESGIHLKINVTSPEDLEDNYYCYQDPLELAQLEEIKVKENKQKAIPRFPKVLGKSSHWSLQWPWKTKRKIIYKESNCYLVPSKYEEKHKDTRKPEVKQDDMIVLDSIHNKGKKKTAKNDNKNEENTLENTRSAGQNSNNVATEQISSINKNNKNEGAMKHNSPIDIKNEDDTVEQNTSLDKNRENVTGEENTFVGKKNEDIVAEEVSSIHKNEVDIAAEKNSTANKNDQDVPTEQNSLAVKTDEDFVEEQNNSVGETDENIVIEPNNLEKNDESDVSDHNISVNKHVEDDVAEQNSSVDKNAEQNSVEVIDPTDINKVNDDNVKFENGDIPVNMTEPENSR